MMYLEFSNWKVLRRAALICCLGVVTGAAAEPEPAKTGSAIFFHIDGAGISHWQAARMLMAGPDGEIHWDKIPHVALYRGHQKDTLTTSSNAGATAHAYGVKVPHASFSTDGTGRRPLAPSGYRRSIMEEAQARGLAVGVVNSGSAVEPGTACFLVSAESRSQNADIVARQLESGVEVILAGGEEWYLPEGVEGRHGKGLRTDGRNLVEEAKEAGYQVVFTQEELAALPSKAGKVLGIFATQDTFNDESEEKLAAKGLPLYDPDSPTIAQMTAAALRFLSGRRFFLVVEEEGPDNFGNYNNAPGVMEALRRADEGLGVALEFVERHPDTLLITFADSEAGNPDIIGLRGSDFEKEMLASGRDRNGAPLDGMVRSESGGIKRPFASQPDRAGRIHRFVIAWGSQLDTYGAILVRAAGLNAQKVSGTFDNTQLYPLLSQTLFGESLAPAE